MRVKGARAYWLKDEGRRMVKLTKIYTKTGDGGRTRLATGEEVSKIDPRVEAYGAVDETNAALGMARAAVDNPTLGEDLARIQNDLFDVGADLATPGPDEALEFEPLRIVTGQVKWLEARIDALNADLEPLNSFILPAGGESIVRLHMARTICRRAERRATALLEADRDRVNPTAVIYLNRLSDYLFVASRWAGRSDGEVLWAPGQNR